MRAFASTSAPLINKKGLITTIARNRATAIIGTQMSIVGIGGTDPIIGITTIRTPVGTTIETNEPLAAKLPAVLCFFFPRETIG
jgi:hypothetical protein